MADYLSRAMVLSDNNIIEVHTKEYGTCEVVPVEYLESLPVIEQDLMEWLVNMAMSKCCHGTTCEECPFGENNNEYNKYCEKLTLEQKLEVCKKIYRSDV